MAMVANAPEATAEEKTDTSPFQKYADAEGFILDYIEKSYILLSCCDCRIPNYYKLLEDQARKSPNMAAELYQSLREGMDLSVEQFSEVHGFSSTGGI
jgi:hypothetical protein